MEGFASSRQHTYGPNKTTHWRHDRPGPHLAWETSFIRAFGPRWQSEASFVRRRILNSKYVVATMQRFKLKFMSMTCTPRLLKGLRIARKPYDPKPRNLARFLLRRPSGVSPLSMSASSYRAIEGFGRRAIRLLSDICLTLTSLLHVSIATI